MGYDAILPLIIYLQLILIWAQVEISIRQLESFSFQFEPSFNIAEESSSIIGGNRVYIHVRNISEWPAYDVKIVRLLKNGKPIPLNSWPQNLVKYTIKCLPPKKDDVLFSFTWKDREHFIRKRVTFEIGYFNRFGNASSFFITFTETGPFIFHEPISRPGFLLNTFEQVALLLKIYRYHLKRKTRQERV